MRNKLIKRLVLLSTAVGMDLHEYSDKEWDQVSNDQLLDLYRDMVIMYYTDPSEEN